MPEKRPDNDDEARWLEEILEHTGFLLKTTLDDRQRDRLTLIQQAARSLAAARTAPAPKSRNNDQHPANTPASAPPPETTARTPLNALLVEDNPFTQKLINRLLTNRGYRIQLANNGREAVDIARNNPFDLILMDVRMPVMDGLEAARTIRRMEKEHRREPTPIITISALVSEADRERAREAGMDGFHGKPVRATVLFNEIDRIVQKNAPPPLVNEAEPPPVKPGDGDCTLDMERLLKTVDNDWSLLGDVAQLYFIDTPRQIENIQQAIIDNRPDEVREAAHSVKGASGAFGKSRVYDLALELEQMGRTGDLSQAEPRLVELKHALKNLEKKLRQELAEHGVTVT